MQRFASSQSYLRPMPQTATQVLGAEQVMRKIDRIAYQIYENNHREEQVILAGIAHNGYRLAQLIAERLRAISPIEVRLVPVFIDKENPLSSEPEVDLQREDVDDRVVILIDDVLNSGRTLAYGLKYFLKVPIRSIQTAVLIDRDHKRYPLRADYVGLQLSTTLQEHVRVVFDDDQTRVILE